jgi:hypothetical protein
VLLFLCLVCRALPGQCVRLCSGTARSGRLSETKQTSKRREQDARDYQLIPKLQSRLDLLLRIAQSILVPRALAPYLVRIRLYHDLRLHGWVIPYTRDLEDLSIFDDRIRLRPYRPRAYKSSLRLRLKT